ncbi:hypothetical protein SAMN06265348_103250 [Pedobacter westerhofensis]|uniref:Uncharacterized protein n=1 Tax=Pedobacter westerhofensis TaxID=425512 RepID=A0A521C5W9_9SPHI|nr:hypothetical protein [Pedobacter westerhofensis]SMO54808.1 hypothetical protein SAMN06265348_103250 [Pedobacter westerhofensis]
MNLVVCTIFEKHYHYGLAALVDSLHKYGFSGEIYAGYRGALPEWSSAATENTSLEWKGASTLKVTESINVHFLPLLTDFHLANYKPEFMLKLINGLAKNAGGIVYFDPDIVIKCQWDFFETWTSYGVSLVHEIISNDMPATHPIRKGWEAVIKSSNREIKRNITSYINSGFCGVIKENVEFLETWADIIQVAIREYGFKSNEFAHSKRTDLFFAKDQDAFNIAAMCSESPISELGAEGMDFINGGFTMSHAVGVGKPWRKNFITSALKGIPPSSADKLFWSSVDGPLKPYSSSQIKTKKIALGVASLIGRFYRKN